VKKMGVNINEHVIHRDDQSATIGYNIPGTGYWTETVLITSTASAENASGSSQVGSREQRVASRPSKRDGKK
jgi:hypothetical protein